MLQVRQLEKIIDNRSALSIERLDLNPGDIMTVIGLVGSGKTLLIRLLSGILSPSGGKVLLEGQEVHQSPEARKRIGVLFEEDLLYDRLSAQQARKSASKLSATVQRRLAFARTLIGRPCLLLLDQPILHVDLDTQSLFARLIVQAAHEGTAVLLTDEDLAWSGKFSTHIMELEDGRVTSSRTRASESEQSEPSAPEHLMPYKVPARKEDRIVLYDPGELLYATSRDGKTYLRTANEEATTNLTLQELEVRLAGRGFFKAHRAYLVNLQHIKG